MAYVVMAYIVMALFSHGPIQLLPYIVYSCDLCSCVLFSYGPFFVLLLPLAHIVMAYIVIAYTVMAYI